MSDGLLLAARCCSQCLTTKSRIVSGERAAEIIRGCRREGVHFQCHKGSAAGLNVHCRGVHDRFGSRAHSFAEQFGIPIHEIDPDELGEKLTKEFTADLDPVGKRPRLHWHFSNGWTASIVFRQLIRANEDGEFDAAMVAAWPTGNEDEAEIGPTEIGADEAADWVFEIMKRPHNLQGRAK